MKSLLLRSMLWVGCLLFIFVVHGFSQTGWQTTSSLNSFRYNPITFGYNGFLYAVAMDTPSGTFPNYEYAQINPDGTLKSWKKISYTQSSADVLLLEEEGLSGVSIGSTVYVLGGTSRDTSLEFFDGNGAGQANIQLNGELTDFEAQPNMDTTRANCSVVYYNGYLYAMGGYDCIPSDGGCSQPDPTATVEYSKILTDGDWDIVGWQYTRSLNTNSGIMYGGWASNGYIYTLGGTGTIERARQNNDGSLGIWRTVGNPVPVAGTAILTGDSQIYVVGNGGTNYKTSFDPLNGTIGTWTQDTNPMAVPREEGYQVTEVWPYIYALGGKDTTGVFTKKVDFIQEGFTTKEFDFPTASDTNRWVLESANGTDGFPTLSWLSSFNNSTGVIKLQFTAANQGVKMTLFKPQWFSSLSTHWYEMKVHVYVDAPVSPNSLTAAGILFNGVPPDETDISSQGYYSISSGWYYIRDFKESTGGALTMYPQLIFKNNQTTPAALYLDTVEIKEINQPGD